VKGLKHSQGQARTENSVPDHYQTISRPKNELRRVSTADARVQIVRSHRNSRKITKNTLFLMNERRIEINLVQIINPRRKKTEKN
jgi:hypothetical protein